jgi:membrane fusion protein (multidrug efflux system)
MIPDQTLTSFFRQKRKVYYLSILLMALFMAIFALWRIYFYPFETTNDAIIQSADISVSSVLEGQIAELLVKEGLSVKKGDVLFVIDDTFFQIERQQALFALAHGEDEFRLQKIKTDLAEEEFVRAKIEYNAGIISEELLSKADKGLHMQQALLSAIESQIDMLKASLKMADTKLQMCRIVAPCDGVIAKIWHYAGDVISAGQTALTLMDLVHIWVEARIEETKISSIEIGDPVLVTLDAYPGKSFKGTVAVIGAAAASQFALIPPNNSSGNFTKITQRIPLKISFEVPENDSFLYLRPGMSVNVKIQAR